MHISRRVTEDGFSSGFRTFFSSWSQKYLREGRGKKVPAGDLRPPVE